MDIRYITAVPVILSVYLTGCSQVHQPTLSEDFGNAVRTNIAQQVIDPKAGQEDLPPATLGGQKVENSLEQYRKDDGKVDNERLITDMTSSSN
ncbi:hypothetical protein [Sulfuriflexus sp.]|uniref:hypothetical protein n=1 Tax=Sulfuriflexus sp. TaxID=2015443 RepID=UPI0028CC02D0|nr:hypothetical protein [Sulfuriflexus sp.]MDT8403039.1 hypothetical protein [Sulfuriflexus sp.]